MKKYYLTWNDKTTTAFEKLKEALVTAPVLALINYSDMFIIDTDASGICIGVLLMQQGHPISYISKSLAHKHKTVCMIENYWLLYFYCLSGLITC